MKRNILNNLKPAALIVLAVIAFSGLQVFASTYSEPADQSENAAKPVTVSEDDQVMKSNFYSRSFLKAGNTVRMAAPSTTADPTWNRPNAYVAEKAVITPRFMVSGNFGLLSKKSQLRIGSPTVSADLPASQPFAGDAVTPVIIDMNGRGSGGDDPAGREAIELHSTYRAGYVSAKPHITVGTPAFQFSSTANVSNDNNNRKADVIAGKLAFSANTTSGTGVKVLVATDTNGNAVLGTMKIVTNTDGTKRIQVDYPGSPVATGQNSCGVVTQPPADLCPNISGTQTTVPAGMIVDGSGNCITPPVVDLCTNIAGNQTTVPTGMVKDTPGTTPGVCTTPPADMCPNITGTQTSIPAGMALDTNGNCVTDMCPNITGPQSTVPAGYYVDGSGSCLTLRYWTCAPQGVNGWFESKPPGNNYNLPVKIANTSSPYFNTPYCSVANYRPGDKYYRQYDSICAEHSVTPDTSACYPTGNTPIAPSCTGTTYSQPCNP